MRLQTLKPAPARKKVIVAGGGPAGMEAARIAALRGHDVHLYEKGNDLGGQVNLAARIPSRDEFGGVARFLSRQMKKLKVGVHLGVEVTPDLVDQASPDAVVVATGCFPGKLSVPGAKPESLVSTWDVLSGLKKVGHRVMLVDDEGYHQGPGVAVLLAEQGKEVEVITRLPFVGFELAASGEMGLLYRKLFSLSVVLTPFTALKRVDGRSVTVANVLSGGESERQHIDTVVILAGNTANDSLYQSLKGKVKELYAVGDCVAPRRAMDAIFDAHRIARLI